MTQLEATLLLARRGNAAVLPQLAKTLDEHPEIWRDFGDLTRMAEQSWIDQIAGTDLLHGQSIRRYVEKMREDLGGPSPSPLEQVVVNQIVVCWLASQYASIAEAASGGDGVKVGLLKMKRAESGNRRILAAAKNLATIRRLLGGLKIEVTHVSPTSEAPAAAHLQPVGEALRDASGSTTNIDGAVSNGTAVSERLSNFFDGSQADRRKPAGSVAP